MIKHLFIDTTQKQKCLSEVMVADGTKNILWWYGNISYMGEDGLEDFLYASAFLALGNKQEAINIMQPKATGSLTYVEQDIDGEIIKVYTDTRNWYQNWLDNNT